MSKVIMCTQTVYTAYFIPKIRNRYFLVLDLISELEGDDGLIKFNNDVDNHIEKKDVDSHIRKTDVDTHNWAKSVDNYIRRTDVDNYNR